MVEFAAGIAPGDVTVTRTNNGKNLLLSIAGGDSITLRDTMTSQFYRVEEVRFAGGVTWTHADMAAMSVAGTAANDVFFGTDDTEMTNDGVDDDLSAFGCEAPQHASRLGMAGIMQNSQQPLQWPDFRIDSLNNRPGTEVSSSDRLDTDAGAAAGSHVAPGDLDRRAALIIQEMTTFGVQSTGDGLGNWQREFERPMEFFA